MMLIDINKNPLYLKKDSIVKFNFSVNTLEHFNTPDILEVMLCNHEDEEWERMSPAMKDGDRWHGNLNELGRLIWGIPYKSKQDSSLSKVETTSPPKIEQIVFLLLVVARVRRREKDGGVSSFVVAFEGDK